MYNAEQVVDAFADVIELLTRGEVNQAEYRVRALDLASIAEVRRTRLEQASSVPLPTNVADRRDSRRSLERSKAAVFAADSWTCRLCGARTIDLRVLRRASDLLGADFPYHPNWKFGSSHLLYWTHSSSLEHVTPLARGGEDAASNWVTTCYACNDARGHRLLEEIGWELRPNQQSGWLGLTQYLGRF